MRDRRLREAVAFDQDFPAAEFTTMMTWSRLPRTHRPTICSVRPTMPKSAPIGYMSAVSRKFTPGIYMDVADDIPTAKRKMRAAHDEAHEKIEEALN